MNQEVLIHVNGILKAEGSYGSFLHTASSTGEIVDFVDYWVRRHGEDCDKFPLEMAQKAWATQYKFWQIEKSL